MKIILIDITKRLRFFLAFVLSLMLFGCAPIVYFFGINNTDLKDSDLTALRDGDLLKVSEGYELRETASHKKEPLNFSEHAVLCDIYIKHVSIGKANACLKKLEEYKEGGESPSEDPKVKERIAGKRALLALIQGDFKRAAELTKEGKNFGNRYVHAIAEAKMDNHKVALDTANEWTYSYEPIKVYLAGNLYLVVGQYEKALHTLNDLERRLSKDYSLSGTKDIFGNKIEPAPLKFDLFGEFGFGLLDTYSYAPQGNIYVEYVLAKCYKELGQKAEAIKRFDKILSFPKVAAYRDVYWLSLYERGLLAEADGKQQEAIDSYKRSVDIIESARASITTDAGKIGFVGDKQNVYAKLIDLLAANGKADEAFEYTERSRSRSLVDLLATVQKFGHHKAEPAGSDQLISAYEKAEYKMIEAQGKPPEEIKLRGGTQTLERRKIINNDRILGSLLAVDYSKIPDIQPHLHDEEAILSYFETGGNWRLDLISKKGGHQDFKLEEKIDKKVITQFLNDLQMNKKTSKSGNNLHNILFKKEVKVALKENGIKKLIIVPYGPLHYIPFAALPPSDGTYLIQNFSIRTIPSASLLEFFLKHSANKQSYLIFGNPSRPNKGDNLPKAKEEAEKIAQLVNPHDIYVDSLATKDTLLQLAPNNKFLHIAAHLKFDSKNALNSRLLLATEIENDPDADLEVNTLFNLHKPWDAKLVVLSACESGKVALSNGDEIIGFERGFFYAGADSILGTLWSIPDDGTPEFMADFYEKLNFVSPATALQEAQKIAIDKQSNPNMWAAFSLAGAD